MPPRSPSPPREPGRTRAARAAGRRLLAAASLLVAGAAGCDRGDPVSPARGFGTFEGRWDGEEWRGQGVAVLVADTLHVLGHRPDPEYYYDEYVRARVAFRGVGVYAVDSDGGSLEQIVGGDAGYFPRAAGVLRVTAYDASARRVRGTLALTVASRDFSWRFSDGTFDVPVYSAWSEVPWPRRR